MKFLTDTFTDADETLLEDHEVEFGGWSIHSEVTGDYGLAIVGNALGLPPDTSPTSATVSRFYYGGDPTGSEHDVYGSFIVPSGTLDGAGIVLAGRVDSVDATWYAVELTVATTGFASITLYKKIAGTRTDLGTYSDAFFIAGDGHTLLLRLWNKNKSVYLDGTEVIRSTDNTITDTGQVGVQGLGSVLPLAEIYADWYENASLNDTFTDTDGVLLENHLADSGHTWDPVLGMSVKTNAAIGYDGYATSSWIPPGPEYDVNAVVIPLLSGSVDEKVSVTARDLGVTYYEMEIVTGVTECPVYVPPPEQPPECPTPVAPTLPPKQPTPPPEQPPPEQPTPPPEQPPPITYPRYIGRVYHYSPPSPFQYFCEKWEIYPGGVYEYRNCIIVASTAIADGVPYSPVNT